MHGILIGFTPTPASLCRLTRMYVCVLTNICKCRGRADVVKASMFECVYVNENLFLLYQ